MSNTKTNFIENLETDFKKHKSIYNFYAVVISLLLLGVGLLFVVVDAQTNHSTTIEVWRVIGSIFLSFSLIFAAAAQFIMYSQKYLPSDKRKKFTIILLAIAFGLVALGCLLDIIYAIIFQLDEHINNKHWIYVALLVNTPTVIGIAIFATLVFTKKEIGKDVLKYILYGTLMVFLLVQEITLIARVAAGHMDASGFEVALGDLGGNALYTVLILSFLLIINGAVAGLKEELAIFVLVIIVALVAILSYALSFLTYGKGGFPALDAIIISIELVATAWLALFLPSFSHAVKTPRASINKV